MTTIIVPVQTTKEVNCIIQEGIRYCEKKEIPKEEVGYGLLFIALFFAWVIFWAWFAAEKDKGMFALFCGLFAPLIIGGLILIK